MKLKSMTLSCVYIFSSGITQQLLPSRPVATYSIIAMDKTTGQLGVAVQSHWFSVGFLVPWAKAGVGAVATQSICKSRLWPGWIEADGIRNDCYKSFGDFNDRHSSNPSGLEFQATVYSGSSGQAGYTKRSSDFKGPY